MSVYLSAIYINIELFMDVGHKITQQMLKSHSGEFDVESIHTLALPGIGKWINI